MRYGSAATATKENHNTSGHNPFANLKDLLNSKKAN
jgi:hypothetical protein